MFNTTNKTTSRMTGSVGRLVGQSIAASLSDQTAQCGAVHVWATDRGGGWNGWWVNGGGVQRSDKRMSSIEISIEIEYRLD